jgi:tetratricopeptide (TPR) repeat protein
MDTIVLIITLVLGGLGILLVWLGYQKDKADNPKAKEVLGKRILILTIAVAMVNGIAFPLIKYFEPKPPPGATRQDVEEIVAQYIGEKPKNPPAKEVKSEIEKELKAAFEKQEKKALELYELGDSAYDNNQFKEAITHFKAALEIVKTPSIYFSLGNSLLVTSDFTSAKAAYQTALELFRKKKDKNGEGNSLGNLGLAYRALGQVEKAIEYYKQALAISRARKTENGTERKTRKTGRC